MQPDISVSSPRAATVSSASIVVQIRLDIPNYSDALSALFAVATKAVHDSDPFLRLIPLRHTVHSGPIRNVPGPEPLDHPLELTEQSAAIDKETIRETEVEEFTEVLHRFAIGIARQRAEFTFRMMDEITRKTGNAISNEGKPLTYGVLIDMIEQAEMSFDEEGKPQSSIVMSPDLYRRLTALQPTAEEEQRIAAVMRRKRAEHDAQKRTRRLSR